MARLRCDMGRTCNEFLALIAPEAAGVHGLLSSATQRHAVDELVFYSKLVADSYRYLAEWATGDERDELTRKAAEAYARTTEFVDLLPTTSTVRALLCQHPLNEKPLGSVLG